MEWISNMSDVPQVGKNRAGLGIQSGYDIY